MNVFTNINKHTLPMILPTSYGREKQNQRVGLRFALYTMQISNLAMSKLNTLSMPYRCPTHPHILCEKGATRPRIPIEKLQT